MASEIPIYCLKPEDLPCFWEIAEHVFAGHLSKRERADVLMARFGKAERLLSPEGWPSTGLFLSGCEVSEDHALEYLDHLPAALPVYPGIGFLRMVLAGMSLLDGDARQRSASSASDRMIRLQRGGMPSLRDLAGHTKELEKNTAEGRKLVVSSLDRNAKQEMLRRNKVLIASPDNLRELSLDPESFQVRIEPDDNEWHVLVCEPDDDGRWLEGGDVFDNAQRVTCPEVMAELLQGRMPVVWDSRDRLRLQSFIGQQSPGYPKHYSIGCLSETVLYVLDEEEDGIWEACTELLVTSRVPKSRHELITRWSRFPSIVMADLYTTVSAFRAECIRLRSPKEMNSYGMIAGPAFSDKELAYLQ